MNPKIYKPIFLLVFVMSTMFPVFGQDATDFVQKVKVSEDYLVLETDGRYQNFVLELVGPDDLFIRKEYKETKEIKLSSLGLSEKEFQNGRYHLQLTPTILLTQKEQQRLRYLMAKDETEKIKAIKEMHNIPDEVNKYSWYFSIEDQAFVLPKKEAVGLKLPTDDTPNSLSALKSIELQPKASFTSFFGQPKPQFIAQVFVTDVVIQGSSCIGFDCVNGESFGFDSQRLKENNLRIHFQDTSNSASFPTNDWRILANDTSNGGSNYLGIEDANTGRIPFRVEAGALQHALYVAGNGNVGFGTSTPDKKIQATTGDSPAIRLEQDGTDGFDPQTWDIAANEANLFIKDVTNGSAIPFKIAVGAPANSFCIAADGNITTVGTINGSDRRLKKDILNMSSMLSMIQQLQPRQYHYRPEFGLSKNLQFGLIAQEVATVFPHLVTDLSLIHI